MMSEHLDVKAIRTGLELTQAQLAVLVGVDQSTISNWESGGTTPRGPARKLLERLAEEAPAPERASQ